MSKIPVGNSFSYAYQFAIGNFFNVLGVVWLPLAATIAIVYFTFGDYFNAILEFQKTRDPSKLLSAGSAYFAGSLVNLFLACIMYVGLSRLALGLMRGPVFFYINIGRREFRMLGHFLLLFLIMIGVMICVSIVASLGIGAALQPSTGAGTGRGVGGIAAVAVGIGLVVFLIWFFTRLTFLLGPVIAAEPSGGIGRSFQLMKGNVLRAIGLMIIVFLPFVFVVGIVEFVVLGDAFTAMMPHPGSPPSPEAMQRQMQEFLRILVDKLPLLLLIFTPLTVFMYGLAAGVSAAAYRALVPPDNAHA